MAHELSHVRNYDIRFSLMVGVLVGSIALLADFFLRFTFWGGGRRSRRGSDSGSGGLQIVVFLVAIVLAILAPIMARLVQMAVSRQREYLADVSGVELTRNPYGLERALAKISLDTEPLEVANRATQHLYFDNPVKAATSTSRSLFSTHPAALDRINRLRQLSGQPPVANAAVVLDPGAQAALARGPAQPPS
jgi:heat shock protein HtpX